MRPTRFVTVMATDCGRVTHRRHRNALRDWNAGKEPPRLSQVPDVTPPKKVRKFVSEESLLDPSPVTITADSVDGDGGEETRKLTEYEIFQSLQLQGCKRQWQWNVLRANFELCRQYLRNSIYSTYWIISNWIKFTVLFCAVLIMCVCVCFFTLFKIVFLLDYTGFLWSIKLFIVLKCTKVFFKD